MTAVNELLRKLIRPTKLLLVEDDQDVGRAFSYWIHESYVCNLKWVLTGEAALDVINQESDFDLIFLDLRLPGINGVEVLRHIKAKWPDLPVVIITGWANSTLAHEAASLGVVGLFAKPVDGRALEHLFKTYKIRARTWEDQAYFDQVAGTVAA